MQVQFRDQCVKVFVLITDAPCHRAEEIPEIAKRLRKQGIKTHVVARESQRELYQPLYQGNGAFHALDDARFETLLGDIAENVKRYVTEE
jgi:hypothetical protein